MDRRTVAKKAFARYYRWYYRVMMRARKLAISLAEDVVSAIDTLAKAQGTSRSAWIEHAARAAIRQQGLRDAVAQSGTKSTPKALEKLREELGW